MQLSVRIGLLLPHLNERQRRLLLAVEARLLGHGGVRAVAQVARVSETTVRKGLLELDADQGPLPLGRVQAAGRWAQTGRGRRPRLVPALLGLVEPDERGDPMSPLRWTTKSLRHLADRAGPAGACGVGAHGRQAAARAGFSLQATAKTLEGAQHPDRDAQFRYINEQVKAHQADGEPVISVDTKKKELLGQLPNAGREWRPKGDPIEVEAHSFFTGPHVEQAIPYGIYDLTRDTGWVNVGVDHDTAAFAVESIRRWWQARGRLDYPDGDAAADHRGRGRLQRLPLPGLEGGAGRGWPPRPACPITVCHFPPGTSKWNKIEHRLFSHITMNWRGRPLTSHEVVVQTIGATRPAPGCGSRPPWTPATTRPGSRSARRTLRRPAAPAARHPRRLELHHLPSCRAAQPASGHQRPTGGGQARGDAADPGAPAADWHAPTGAGRAGPQAGLRAGGRPGAALLPAARRSAPPDPGAHGRPILSDRDRLLVAVVYLRQVCSQQVLADLLGVTQ